jgi:hypothetical protein
MDNVTNQIQVLEIVAEPAPDPAAQGIQTISLEQEANTRHFLDPIFLGATPAELAPPERPHAKPHFRAAFVEPTRRSLRQATAKSIIPVFQRAINHLIR